MRRSEANAVTSLEQFIQDFANAVIAADHTRPKAADAVLSRPGIGTLPEAEALHLIAQQLELADPATYADRIALDVPYPGSPGRNCSLSIGSPPVWTFSAEVRMLRYVDEEGRLSDNILARHRSAVAGCVDLANSTLGESKAVIVYGFDDSQWPLDPAIDAFERMARAKVKLGERCSAPFDTLWHPVYARGRAFGWAIG